MNKHAIYIVERDLSFGENPHFHCFLMLVDESSGSFEKATVLEQLHYVEENIAEDTPTPKMVHDWRISLSSPKRLNQCEIAPVVSGDADFIMPIWRHALNFAQEIDNSPIYFGHDYTLVPHANNCRSAVKETLRVCGLSFNDDFSCKAFGRDHAPGLDANSIRRVLPEYPCLSL